MRFIRKYWSLIALAACIAAALVFRRFTYVAWYPVLMSAATACGFAISLFGKESLCYTLAKKIPPYIMPDGAKEYCRKYTAFWSAWLCVNGLIAAGTIYAPGPVWKIESAGIDMPVVWVVWNCCLSYCATGLIILGEWLYRRRRFAVVFHTSGSTAKPKTIVKTFDTLAKEVAYHHRQFVNRGILKYNSEFGIRNSELDGQTIGCFADNLASLPQEIATSLGAERRTLRNDGYVEPGVMNHESGTMNHEPTFLTTIEPQHMYGQLWRVLLPRVAGVKLVDETILTPESLIEHMREAGKVFLVTTPSFLAHFCAYADQYDVPQNCVEIVTSGALLTSDVSAATKHVFGIAPLEIFGSTETGGVACRRQDNSEFGIRNSELTNEPITNQHYDWSVFEPVKVSVSGEGRLVVNSPFSFRKNFEMGDGVELSPDGRSFKLLGRRDRLVKIAEQRVSLPEMEEKMCALEDVKEVALAVLDGAHGPTLGAVIVLNLDVADVAQGKKKLVMELRRKCMPIFPKGTVPKRYRFVSELPRNAQGKVQSGALRRELESNLVEPFVFAESRTESSWTADLVFDADAPYFKGHFPDFAVLPGVVQLGMAQHFAEKLLRRSIILESVKKMKFTSVIVPGVHVTLNLVKKSECEISYEYMKGETSCSSGVLCF